MRKLKKSLIIMLSAVMLISSGCGKKEDVKETDDKPTISIKNEKDKIKPKESSKNSNDASQVSQEEIITEDKEQSVGDTELSKDLFSGQFVLEDHIYTLAFKKSSIGKDVDSSGIVKYDDKNKFTVGINKEQSSDGKFNDVVKSVKVTAENAPTLPFSIVNGLKIGSSKDDLEKTFKVVNSRNDLEKEIKEENGVIKYRYSDGIFITLNFEVKNDKITSIEIILE